MWEGVEEIETWIKARQKEHEIFLGFVQGVCDSRGIVEECGESLEVCTHARQVMPTFMEFDQISNIVKLAMNKLRDLGVKPNSIRSMAEGEKIIDNIMQDPGISEAIKAVGGQMQIIDIVSADDDDDEFPSGFKSPLT